MLDCRYHEDFPDSQVTEVPYAVTENKSAEEEKCNIPKKVGSMFSSELLKLLITSVLSMLCSVLLVSSLCSSSYHTLEGSKVLFVVIM